MGSCRSARRRRSVKNYGGVRALAAFYLSTHFGTLHENRPYETKETTPEKHVLTPPFFSPSIPPLK